MSDEKLNFLDAEEPAPVTTEATPQPAAPEPAAAPEPEPQGDARARDPETGRFVPISALLDERDKRQAETAKRIDLEAQLQRYQQPQQPEQVPTDPSGIIQYALAEQQRIAFARALLQRPAWLFMDEATSALDEETEAALYGLLQARLPHTAVISIGHRNSLRALHQQTLEIIRDENGESRLLEARPTA